MNTKNSGEYDTIIVGAGMAGIGCAKKLAEKSRDFLLISKDIGGRVVCSTDGNTNYGAFYIRSDYHHILPFVRLKKKITKGSVRFQRGNSSWTFWNVLLDHPIKIVKLFFLLFLFDSHYQKFKKDSEKMSQIEAIQNDPYLVKMHATRASDFLKTHNLDVLIPTIIDPLVKSTAFLDVEEMPLSAAGMLLLLLLGIYSTHEFEMREDLLTAGIEKNIIKGEVSLVAFADGRWVIKTTAGKEYHSENLVMATPIHISKQLLNIDIQTNRPISVHMAHLRGQLLPVYQNDGDFILFSSHTTQDIVISKELNNAYLFYSHNPHYDLSKYFSNHEIITEKFWHPAFFIGHDFIPSRFDNNLFVIGDHNVVGMEDAFITGVYAANKILEETSN